MLAIVDSLLFMLVCTSSAAPIFKVGQSYMPVSPYSSANQAEEGLIKRSRNMIQEHRSSSLRLASSSPAGHLSPNPTLRRGLPSSLRFSLPRNSASPGLGVPSRRRPTTPPITLIMGGIASKGLISSASRTVKDCVRRACNFVTNKAASLFHRLPPGSPHSMTSAHDSHEAHSGHSVASSLSNPPSPSNPPSSHSSSDEGIAAIREQTSTWTPHASSSRLGTEEIEEEAARQRRPALRDLMAADPQPKGRTLASRFEASPHMSPRSSKRDDDTPAALVGDDVEGSGNRLVKRQGNAGLTSAPASQRSRPTGAQTSARRRTRSR